MRLGIIGLPQSGKTNLFNALTLAAQPTGIATGKIEKNTAMVDVPDSRVDRRDFHRSGDPKAGVHHATFIGNLLGGMPWALLATLGIFLPSFIYVLISGRFIPYLRDSAWASAFLDGVNVASPGLMLGVTIQLSATAAELCSARVTNCRPLRAEHPIGLWRIAGSSDTAAGFKMSAWIMKAIICPV